jgi:hypothetical protein
MFRCQVCKEEMPGPIRFHCKCGEPPNVNDVCACGGSRPQATVHSITRRQSSVRFSIVDRVVA